VALAQSEAEALGEAEAPPEGEGAVLTDCVPVTAALALLVLVASKVGEGKGEGLAGELCEGKDERLALEEGETLARLVLLRAPLALAVPRAVALTLGETEALSKAESEAH
jgi:hypothetical protein